MTITIVKSKRVMMPLLITTGLLLSGCSSMKDVIEKNGGELAPEHDSIVEEVKSNIAETKESLTDEINPSLEEYPLSEKQEELLAGAASQTAEDAVAYLESNLSELAVLDTSVKPVEKEAFYDAVEAGKYFSYYFFQFNAGLMDAATFYKGIKNHLSPSFLDQLPVSDEDRIATFAATQEIFDEYLHYKITDYKMSELEYTHLKLDATFHRSYILENGQTINYMTSMERAAEDDRWLLVDDGPSIGFNEKDATNE